MPSISVEAPKADVVSGDNKTFLESFTVGSYLGRGAFGEVKRCMSRVDGSTYAVKELDRGRMSKEAEEATVKEIEVSKVALEFCKEYKEGACLFKGL